MGQWKITTHGPVPEKETWKSPLKVLSTHTLCRHVMAYFAIETQVRLWNPCVLTPYTDRWRKCHTTILDCMWTLTWAMRTASKLTSVVSNQCWDIFRFESLSDLRCSNAGWSMHVVSWLGFPGKHRQSCKLDTYGLQMTSQMLREKGDSPERGNPHNSQMLSEFRVFALILHPYAYPQSHQWTNIFVVMTLSEVTIAS